MAGSAHALCQCVFLLYVCIASYLSAVMCAWYLSLISDNLNVTPKISVFYHKSKSHRVLPYQCVWDGKDDRTSQKRSLREFKVLKIKYYSLCLCLWRIRRVFRIWAANVIQISNPYSERVALGGNDDKKARKKAQRINSTGAQGENDDKSSYYVAIKRHL